MELKQVILIRKDLKLPIGKACSQAAHAAVESSLKADKDVLKKWRAYGQKKVVLKVDSQKELYEYLQKAKDMGIACALISDAGRTVIEPGTVTALGIGPDDEDKIDSVTSKLKML
jgi:peptidyl-tRNA hydrolase, PTH2 family